VERRAISEGNELGTIDRRSVAEVEGSIKRLGIATARLSLVDELPDTAQAETVDLGPVIHLATMRLTKEVDEWLTKDAIRPDLLLSISMPHHPSTTSWLVVDDAAVTVLLLTRGCLAEALGEQTVAHTQDQVSGL